MSARRLLNRSFASRPRRGTAALGAAVAFMIVIFTGLLAFTTLLAQSSLQTERAVASTQALYAAEAGVDLLLQTGAAQLTGACGRGQYAAAARGGRVVGVGQVELASGVWIRRAVAVDRGAPAGTWRELPPASQTALLTLLAPAPEVSP
jgi:hypothetical protein